MPQPLGNNSPETFLTPFNYILQVFAASKRQPLSSQQAAYLQPFMTDSAMDSYAALEKIAFASNFVLLPLTEIARENAKRDAPLIGLTKHWLLFATTSNGDAWLIRKHQSSTEVAFLDHQLGRNATALPLEIDFEQWLQLAYLMHQIELCMISPNIVEINNAFNRLHPELSKRYPYQLRH